MRRDLLVTRHSQRMWLGVKLKVARLQLASSTIHLEQGQEDLVRKNRYHALFVELYVSSTQTSSHHGAETKVVA
jgi:hypothetical protein